MAISAPFAGLADQEPDGSPTQYPSRLAISDAWEARLEEAIDTEDYAPSRHWYDSESGTWYALHPFVALERVGAAEAEILEQSRRDLAEVEE